MSTTNVAPNGVLTVFVNPDGSPANIQLDDLGRLPCIGTGTIAAGITVSDGTTLTQKWAVGANGAGFVQGPTAAGSAPAGNPVDIAADNTGKTRRILTDTTGKPQVAVTSLPGSPAQDTTLASVLAALQGVLSVNGGATATATIAAGVGTKAVKAAAGRLCRVLVTALGTGGLTLYDNASAASGTVIGIVPASTPAGTVLDFEMPAANGIFASNAANGPAVTLSYL
jgi:hypothetical protein